MENTQKAMTAKYDNAIRLAKGDYLYMDLIDLHSSENKQATETVNMIERNDA